MSSPFLEYIKQSSERAAKPPRIVLYGTSKIGKTTWASQAPSPIFIPTEDGLSGIDNVHCFPLCKDYQAVINAVDGLRTEEHSFKTVVLDSGDWLEALLHTKIAGEAGKAHVSDIGYGTGYARAQDELVCLLNKLDRLRDERGMMVIILNHHESKEFNDPLTEAYHRYTLKMHKSAVAKVQEWADIIAFANFKTMVLKEQKGFNASRNRVSGTGERVMHLVEKPGFVAGNRYGLADDLPMDFTAFETEFEEKTGRTLV